MHSPTEIENVTIHRGSVTDAAELAAFAAKSFEETYSADNNPDDLRAHLDNSYSLAQQTAELIDPLVLTVLARLDEELVAFAQVRRNTPPSCVTHAAPIELHRFYVDQRAHGSGLASKLMQAVHEAVRELQGRHIWLSVWERNPRAIAFYKKEKFVDAGNTHYMVGPDKQTDRVLVAEVQPRVSDAAENN